MDFHGFGEKADAVHLRHALVGQQERDGVIASLKLAKGGKGGAAGAGAHDAIFVGIVAPKVALDSSQDLRVVVDGKEDRFRHIPQMIWKRDSLQLSRQARSLV
jgi:hypothetical protein